ncbi:MAG: sugar phosphate nucleotidyltransferase [Candidatus Berkelbacteria bacterium]|nr:sugar phosphate nucleotidyltransferase [Candidatus Berkelbacteria bacterium]
MYAVIMAGGKGTRLWPLSRTKKPKQLHSFISDKSLIRETYERLLPSFPSAKILISTTPEYLVDIKKIIPEIAEDDFIVEPYPMGTAAACGLATKIINMRDSEAAVIFLPADHSIKDNGKFLEAVGFAEELCENEYDGYILTIGINPTKPDTGLGYIKMGSQVEESDNLRAFSVEKFVEKPNLEKAEEYVSSWEYLWNSGIFIWKTKKMLELFAKYLPETTKVLENVGQNLGTALYEKVLRNDYKKVENTSIDYGILEKTKEILVVPADFGWSDVGSWGTLLSELTKNYNTKVISRGHHIGVDNDNCLFFAGDKLIATVGLTDIIVVDTSDALLICNSHKSGQVKDLLEKFQQDDKHHYL